MVNYTHVLINIVMMPSSNIYHYICTDVFIFSVGSSLKNNIFLIDEQVNQQQNMFANE